MDKEKRGRQIKIILVAIIIATTIVRLLIGLFLPMVLLGEAKYDDFMMTEYAEGIISGNWLGDFTYKSLIKNASFPILLCFSHISGLSYPFMLNLLYIAAVSLLALAMNKLIRNRIWTALFYIFMLYSPVMLHEENVQKLYRGGYIIVFAIFVIAAVIGMFGNYDNPAKTTGYSVLLSVTLPIFWYLKEDSIWIMPFVIAGLICTFVRCLIAKKRGVLLIKRICCYVIPFVVLFISMMAYKSINNKYYGLAVNNDREDTYFEAVITDIMKVENASDGKAWVTQEALHRVMAESDTFRQMAYEIDMSCDVRLKEDGEVHGDYIIWALREAAYARGLYDGGAAAWDSYWEQVHKELSEAYAEGRLTKDSESVYLSGIARGFTLSEMKEYYMGNAREVLLALLTYRTNVATTASSTGSMEQIERMHKLSGAGYISESSTEAELQKYEKTVNLANLVTHIYSMTGIPLLLLSVAGCVLLLIRYIANTVKKKPNNDGWMLLLIAGMLLSAALVIFAVMWFCNFLTVYKVYDYSGGAVIFIEIVEALGLFYLADIATAYLKRKKDKSK